MIERYRYIDYLRILAFLFVVMVHCNDPIIGDKSIFNTATWWLSDGINSLTRTGVPIFFMISGFLLLNDERTLNIKEFYKRRVLKILVPFLVWDTIFFIYNKLLYHDAITLKMYLNELLNTGSSYHLWYVYVIMGLYLLYPFLKILVDRCSFSQLSVLLIISTLITTIKPLISTTYNITIYLMDPIMNGYLGYVILGYLLGKADLRKNQRQIIYIAGIIGFAASIRGNFIHSSVDGINLVYNNAFQICFFLSASAIFVFIKQFDDTKCKRLQTIGTKLSPLSFGVYFIHPIVRDLFEWLTQSFQPIWHLLATYAGTVIVSIFVIFLISKVKILRRLLI